MALATRGVKPPFKSRFQQWLETLTEQNLTVVTGWLNDTASYTNADVIRMISDDDPEDDFVGYRANKDTISEWRRLNVPRG